MKIGVFDSGSGGRNVLRVLAAKMPDHEFYYRSDRKNVPYGEKTPSEIKNLTKKRVTKLIELGCEIVVIACNTASSYALVSLRRTWPNVKFVGLEPMVKPAALATKTGTIAVCATPATLASPNYVRLKEKYAGQAKIIEPDCAAWATLIEQGRTAEIDLEKLAADLRRAQCDVVVLGCTHYHVIADALEKLLPNVTIFEPSDAVVRRVNDIMC